jgi:hypothetical protein
VDGAITEFENPQHPHRRYGYTWIAFIPLLPTRLLSRV